MFLAQIYLVLRASHIDILAPTYTHPLFYRLALAVMFLTQMYPALGASYQEAITLLMLEACKVTGPQMESIHPSLAPVYADLRTAQVCILVVCVRKFCCVCELCVMCYVCVCVFVRLCELCVTYVCACWCIR